MNKQWEMFNSRHVNVKQISFHDQDHLSHQRNCRNNSLHHRHNSSLSAVARENRARKYEKLLTAKLIGNYLRCYCAIKLIFLFLSASGAHAEVWLSKSRARAEPQQIFNNKHLITSLQRSRLCLNANISTQSTKLISRTSELKSWENICFLSITEALALLPADEKKINCHTSGRAL